MLYILNLIFFFIFVFLLSKNVLILILSNWNKKNPKLYCWIFRIADRDEKSKLTCTWTWPKSGLLQLTWKKTCFILHVFISDQWTGIWCISHKIWSFRSPFNIISITLLSQIRVSDKRKKQSGWRGGGVPIKPFYAYTI